MFTLPATDARYRAARRGEATYGMPDYDDLRAWQARAIELRAHLLAVQGLWPLPERTPLNAHRFGRVEYPDYAIEKVYFESHPGFFCTGNLYTPRGASAPYPAILSPHGHWQHGRLEQGADGGVRARCVTLARMGLAVFAYDMVGYNDSVQVPDHKFLTRRGALWGYTPLALQTWNSLRAVDFLLSLPEVDPERLGCTGASGGATQLLLLAAAEERVRVLAPVNMISAHFQGGCACENAPGLRTATFNVEIAALAAPRPMLMVSATGDWTANTPRVEYPAVRDIYALYGAEDRLAWVQEDAPHNYNRASRAHVYRWFARWFLGDEALGRDVEGEIPVEPAERLRVFAGGELPAGAPRGAALEGHLTALAHARLEALRPADPGALDRLAAVSRERLRHILDVSVPNPDTVIAEPAGEPSAGAGWQAQSWWLGRAGMGDRLAATVYRAAAGRAADAPARWAVAVSGSGQEGLLDAAGEPGALIRGLLDRGYVVLAPSPLYCGPVPADALPRHDDDPTWLCFNTSLLGLRVQDVATALAHAAAQGPAPLLVGLGNAGLWALLAAALSGLPCAVAADLPDDADEAYLEAAFAPALRAYGDVRAAVAAIVPRPLLLGRATPGDGPSAWAQAAYAAAKSGAAWRGLSAGLRPENVLAWLPADGEDGHAG